MEDEVDLEPALEARLIDGVMRGVTQDVRAQQARRRQRVFAAVGALALAASVAVILSWPRSDELPPYALSIPEDARVLSAPPKESELTRLTMDSTLRVDLRPHRRVSTEHGQGPPQVVPFLRGPGPAAQVRRWAVTLQPADSGTFRLQVPVRELPDLGPGRYTLFFAVGPAGAGEAPAAAQLGEAARLGPWQVLRKDVLIAPATP